jgi:hypothetical protein
MIDDKLLSHHGMVDLYEPSLLANGQSGLESLLYL